MRESVFENSDYMGLIRRPDGTFSLLGNDGFEEEINLAALQELGIADLDELCDYQVVDVNPLDVRDTEPQPNTET
ncbi:hypothetical protein [Nocardia sp. NPDC051463]|uniref:hypothetical protein n=1 Tax=Nocardia sp. NPDC051463 TaxID=3154845 RepID=UPI00344B4C57